MDSTVLVVACPDRLPRIECRGGVQARSTAPDTVHLVSSAATPLGGDTIAIRVIVEAGARLRLRSVAATVALPGTGSSTSHSCWDAEVAGDLDLDPEPTIVAAASRHVSGVRIRLGDDGRIRLRERVQIGRSGEREGVWTGSMRVDVPDGPLLRHSVELGAGSLADDVLAAPLACVSELRYPDVCAAGAVGTTLTLAGGGTLSTWQGTRL